MSELPSSRQQYGYLLAFDGIDGSGKSTQIKRVAHDLTEIGLDVHVTRAHGGTPMGEKLRAASLSQTPRQALTDLLISQAIHAELIPDINERRARGQTVLLDRSPLSMTTYQTFGDGLAAEVTRPVVDREMAQFNPDLVIVYDTSVEVALLRAASASSDKRDYFESKGADHYERVRRGYRAEAARYTGIYNLALINTERSINTVFGETLAWIADIMLAGSLDKH